MLPWKRVLEVVRRGGHRGGRGRRLGTAAARTGASWRYLRRGENLHMKQFTIEIVAL